MRLRLSHQGQRLGLGLGQVQGQLIAGLSPLGGSPGT